MTQSPYGPAVPPRRHPILGALAWAGIVIGLIAAWYLFFPPSNPVAPAHTAPATPQNQLTNAVAAALGPPNRPGPDRLTTLTLHNGQLNIAWAINTAGTATARHTGAQQDIADILGAVQHTGAPVHLLDLAGSFPLTDASGVTAERVVLTASYTDTALHQSRSAGTNVRTVLSLASTSWINPDW